MYLICQIDNYSILRTRREYYNDIILYFVDRILSLSKGVMSQSLILIILGVLLEYALLSSLPVI